MPSARAFPVTADRASEALRRRATRERKETVLTRTSLPSRTLGARRRAGAQRIAAAPHGAALLAAGAWLALAAAPVAAATDLLELRERLEVERPAIQTALRSYRRAADASAFPADKPGEAFGRYLAAAWKALDAPRAFPEVHAALGKFRGGLTPGDAAQRQAFAVLLGDYLQVRYGDDVRRELATLVACKSFDNIVDRNIDNPEVRKALDVVADLATRLGLQVHNHDYATLRVTLPAAGAAAGQPAVAVWTHADVPRPVEHKWLSPPWTLTEREERWFGLGVYDGKGPAVVNLFAMRALRDAGLRLSRPVVLLVSTSGEQYAGDAATDVATLSPRPAVVLAAAGSFPYATGELGHLVARVSSTRGMKSRPGIQPGEFFVHKIECYPGISTVPMEVRTWVRYETPLNTNNPSGVMVNEKWRPVIERFQKEHPTSIYETYIQDDTLHFFAYGHPRHVQHADQAENSVYNTAGALLSLPLYRKSSAADVLLWIQEGLQRDPSGKAVGLDHSDPEMGGSWVVPVGFDRLGEEVTVLVDIRWPVGRDAAWVRERFAAALASFDAKHGTKLRLEWEPGGHEPAQITPPPAIAAALDEAAMLATGEAMPPAAVVAASARLLPATIPFGPEWPRGDMHGHVLDESISRRELQDLGVAYAAAMSFLGTAAALPAVP
jgi:succinyl-diaminopimelate desuccinylase